MYRVEKQKSGGRPWRDRLIEKTGSRDAIQRETTVKPEVERMERQQRQQCSGLQGVSRQETPTPGSLMCTGSLQGPRSVLTWSCFCRNVSTAVG